jgi:hypothetical protein|tara:strand:+ start:42 stop:641 length:600 start_codon:yes stop_codon:yes gene_type:complete
LAVNKKRKLREIIENGKIKLSMSEKFRYYRLSIIFFVSTIFCFTEGMTKLPFENFNLTENTLDKIGVFCFLFSLIIFFYFNNNLKVEMISFLYNKKEFINVMNKNLESNQDWKISEKSDNYLIIKTKENAETLGTSRNQIISPNMGNRIYVGLENKEFFVKSLFNLSNEHFLILDNGESKRNEKLIINLIKSTANTVQN